MSSEENDSQSVGGSDQQNNLVPSEQGNNTNNEDLVIMSIRCYLKILMHALRYPHAIVNGLLIMEKRKKTSSSPRSIRLVDCIPLFHSGHGLTPMMEVALNQVSDYFHKSSNNLIIGGYYQANEHFHELPFPTPNIFAERIAEKIYENNSESLLFMLSAYHLATSIDEPDKMNLPLFMYEFNSDGKLKPKSSNPDNRGYQLENNVQCFEALQELIYQKQYHLNLVDFDSHLENVKHDWRNLKLNEAIAKFEQK